MIGQINGSIPAKPQVRCSVKLVFEVAREGSDFFFSFELSHLRALHNDQGCQDLGGMP